MVEFQTHFHELCTYEAYSPLTSLRQLKQYAFNIKSQLPFLNN